MKRVILEIALAMGAASPAFAMKYFLVAQYFENGS